MTGHQRTIAEEIREHGTEILTVHEITSIIQEIFDDTRLQDVWVRGEISNLKLHGSGHRFFSLGERNGNCAAVISCVMWRSDGQRLMFEPEDGMDVLVFGSVGHYAPQGRYQFYVREIRHAGRGEKHLQVERWKEELAKEGCFLPERKRPLPFCPVVVGVVTSETGAVLQDIKNVISRRYPVEIAVSPTAVQGEEAHLEIASAIRRVESKAAVIIVARGGGSFEDLFPFNHPDVVRAIACCPVPVVSAIGHEVDTTLADFAADLRAPTPSAAAEMVVPDRINLLEALHDSGKKMSALLLSRLDRSVSELAELRQRLSPRSMGRKVNERREDLTEYAERLKRSLQARVSYERERLRASGEVLQARNPAYLLGKGYCILEKDGKVLRSARNAARGDRIRIRMWDGMLNAEVREVKHDPEV